jgi:hypothetical protein
MEKQIYSKLKYYLKSKFEKYKRNAKIFLGFDNKLYIERIWKVSGLFTFCCFLLSTIMVITPLTIIAYIWHLSNLMLVCNLFHIFIFCGILSLLEYED